MSAPGILLWPGFGFAGGYFGAVEQLLGARTVAVDPPGWGGSAGLRPSTFPALVQLATELVERHVCTAVVGHSLGACIALGVAADPPVGLRAVVLVDGGYLDEAALADLGSSWPRTHREALVWAVENEPRYSSWAEASAALAADCGGVGTPAIDTALRDVLVEDAGGIRSAVSAEAVACTAVAASEFDTALARRVGVPTLLVACCRPPRTRARKERAWRAFADASPLIHVHVAEDWSHHPFLHAPQESAAVVAGWLRTVL